MGRNLSIGWYLFSRWQKELRTPNCVGIIVIHTSIGLMLKCVVASNLGKAVTIVHGMDPDETQK